MDSPGKVCIPIPDVDFRPEFAQNRSPLQTTICIHLEGRGVIMRIFVISVLLLSGWHATAADIDWQVTRSWTPALEKKFSEFVNILGTSGCRTLTECLTSSASNPFYAARTPKRRYPADCADFPFSLRMYFAWMEELPFDYVSRAVPANSRNETKGDLRYTKFGNKPGAWRTIQAGGTYDFFAELSALRGAVSTATYRMHYDYISDFYPPAISPAQIQPGTVVYDPSGHAAIVYAVQKDGRIRLMDAHPDNSVTRITYDQKFSRSRPRMGRGLRIGGRN
ncbi:MAG: hypothetical protein HC902_09000 [Calothrix sp. SM1_5_4]|nr:hypothetical protein [Calothrix sp. SM1_5_4]